MEAAAATVAEAATATAAATGVGEAMAAIPTTTMMEDTAAEAAAVAVAAERGAGTTRGTRATAAEPAVPEDPLRGEPTAAPDPDPDPGTGQGAVGPGGDVIRLIKVHRRPYEFPNQIQCGKVPHCCIASLIPVILFFFGAFNKGRSVF